MAPSSEAFFALSQIRPVTVESLRVSGHEGPFAPGHLAASRTTAVGLVLHSAPAYPFRAPESVHAFSNES